MLNINKKGALFLILAGCAAPSGWAGTVTLFDNTAFVNGGAVVISQVNPAGDSFSTGAVALNLTDFAAVLDLQNSATGATTFSLYSDNLETPGTQIATLGTIGDSSPTTTPESYTISNLDIALTANTRYWILASATGNALWWSAADSSGTGTAGEFVAANQIFPDSVGLFNMRVAGAVTPEPGTLVLVGSGLALALFRRIRPRRRLPSL
ncbi:MAG: PEP-CTERM sorting domain-containing protein [Acidobacteriota bacterium]|nr:PEP-CTERM sorting domain-containing protein [Acidobacteriota bacterium]